MTQKNKNETKKETVVLYPIFLECKAYTLDPFWCDVFEMCSKGKFPKGMKISSDGTIFIKGEYSKDKEIVQLKGEPLDIFKQLLFVFKTKLGMKSDRDKFKQKQNLEKIKQEYIENFDDNWKQIKHKRIKDKLILDYVINEKKKYHLNDKQTEYLFSLINLGFILKIISGDDVDYGDRKIHSIEGISYDKKKGIHIYENDTTKELKIEKGKAGNKMVKEIEKYIKAYVDNMTQYLLD